MRERDGREGPLHARTRAALWPSSAASGGKAIVMVPRRGWSPHLSCRDCGRAWRCPNCDVSLVLHRVEECSAATTAATPSPCPRRCPDCGSVSVSRHGAGSERIEQLVAGAGRSAAGVPARLGQRRPARGAHGRILGEFERAPGGVLIGTQMVAKGHDFPDVVLSVIVDADSSLRFPDFRAEERTFAQVAQLAGRSGRGAAGGRVLVQTLAPAAEAIRRAARHDAPAFLAGELERRRELAYPPFSTLIRVEFTAPAGRAADDAAAQTAARIRPLLPRGGDAARPGAALSAARPRAPPGPGQGSRPREPAVAAVREAVEAAAAARALRGVQLSVDVDPQ